jgi:hypothetical protein
MDVMREISMMERVAVALANAIVCTVPVTIPALYEGIAAQDGVLHKAHLAALPVVTAILTIAMFGMYCRMNGSLGAVLFGMRVETLNGSTPRFELKLARASPYMVTSLLIAAVRWLGLGAGLRGLFLFFVLVLFAFMAVNIVTLLWTGQSILDKFTRSRLMRIPNYRHPWNA